MSTGDKNTTSEGLESLMRDLVASEISSGGIPTGQPSVVMYAALMPDYDPLPWSPTHITGTSLQALDVTMAQRLVALETRLAQAEARIAELEDRQISANEVDAWTLTREQFIKLAEAASYILSKKPASKTKKRGVKTAP